MSETNDAVAKRRPWHLWVVGMLALLWNAMGALDYVMTETKSEAHMSQFTPEQLEFFYGFPAWLVALWAVAVWGGVLGAVLLLLKKKLAFPVLAVSLGCGLITAIRNFGLSNGLEIMGTAGLVFTIAAVVVAALVVVYSRSMVRRGVLT